MKFERNQCDSCKHNKVCRHKEKYENLFDRVAVNCRDIKDSSAPFFALNLKCDYYSYDFGVDRPEPKKYEF